MGGSPRRLFTLTIIPDSGTETKTGNVHLNFIIASFISIIIIFFFCLFFIIGYQIKLAQEKNYKKSLTAVHNNLERISIAEKNLKTLSLKLEKLQRIDKAYRVFSILPVPDDQVYMAGMGGHEIIDTSFFESLDDGIKPRIKPVALGIKILGQRIKVEKKSMDSIWRDLRKKIDQELYTPTILH